MNSFEKIKNQTPKEIQIFIEKSFDIADEVDFILEKNNVTRSFLAAKLNKSESEISKWLSGIHNLTIKSISKIEACLDEKIISTPTQEAKKTEDILKCLENRLKKIQTKCDELEIENKKLKKLIIKYNSLNQLKYYGIDKLSQKFFRKNFNYASNEMNDFTNNLHIFVFKEWSISDISTPNLSAKQNKNLSNKLVNLTDEYENIVT